jgi:hypothetical protein
LLVKLLLTTPRKRELVVGAPPSGAPAQIEQPKNQLDRPV